TRDRAAFVPENLLLNLVEDSGDGRIHVHGNFLAMIEITTCFDVHFRDVTLMLFNREDEMHLHDFVDDTSQSFETVRCKFPKWFGNFDVATCDIDTHRRPSIS